MASLGEHPGSPHRLRARPRDGPLSQRGGGAYQTAHRICTRAPHARGPIRDRPSAPARPARGRGVRLGRVRPGGDARRVRGAGLHFGLAHAAGAAYVDTVTGESEMQGAMTRRAFAERLALAAAAPFVAIDVALPRDRGTAAPPPQQAEPSPLARALTNADEPDFVFAAFRGPE